MSVLRANKQNVLNKVFINVVFDSNNLGHAFYPNLVGILNKNDREYLIGPGNTVLRPSNSAARWPNFRPKSSKGAGKKMVGRKNFMAKFWPNFVKSGRKGAGILFCKCLIAEIRKMTQETNKLPNTWIFVGSY